MTATNAVTLFDATAGMPAHLVDINEQSNIEIRDIVDTLSFRGKVWRINRGGIETIARNKEGEPVSTLQMVVLDYNKSRSRALYPKYVEGQSKPPICWSNDGVTPDNDVQQKQGAACASCPQSQKGSKINDDGQPGVACASFKRAVVVPIVQPDFPPLLLKVPQTSMYDKDNKENENLGNYAFDQYMEMLKARGVNNTASVVTKLSFDARTSYPKLLFKAAAWLPVEKAEAVRAQLANKDLLEKMLKIVDVSTPSAQAPAPEEFEQAAPAAVTKAPPAPAPAPAAPPPAPKPAAPAPAAPATPRPAKKAAPAPAPTPAPTPAAPPADDDEPVFIAAGEAAPAVAAAKPVNAPAAPAAAPAQAGDALASLVSGWDDGE